MITMQKKAQRELEPKVNAKGQIVAWKCSACNWSKLAENPCHSTERTKAMFEQHRCEEHRRHHAMNALQYLATFLTLAGSFLMAHTLRVITGDQDRKAPSPLRANHDSPCDRIAA